MRSTEDKKKDTENLRTKNLHQMIGKSKKDSTSNWMGVSSPLLNLRIFRGNLKDENTKKKFNRWLDKKSLKK